MGEITYAFAEITKSEADSNGDLYVFGKAAGTDLDLDGQRCDANWLAKALPKWYELGNVRAQHSPVAAGIGVELTQNGSDWTLKSLVVDADSKNKVSKKVYKGYSIGIKGARVIKHASAPNGLIVGGDIVEVSLVDRPANPNARITVCKSAGGSVLLPVDSDGNELAPQDFSGKWLAADMHKAALATAHDVLAGDFDEDTEDSHEALGSLADLLIAEGMSLKAALADGADTFDTQTIQDAAQAIGFFADAADADADLGAPALFKAAFADDKGAATVDVAALVKAEVAKAVQPHLERNQALEAQLAEVMARPVPGGPAVFALPVPPALSKSAQADRYLTMSQTPGLDPEIAHAYVQLANREGANS